MISRRGLLLGLLAAPAIIRTPGLLMPVKPPIASAPAVIWRENRFKPLQLSGQGVRGDDVLLGNEELLYSRMEYREIDMLGRVITDWTPEPIPVPVPVYVASKPRRSRYTNKGVRLA